MEIDTSELNPAEAAQAQMFAMMIENMPDDALTFFIKMFQQELASRHG